MVSTVFNKDDDFYILTERFIKNLDGCIVVNFKNIRICRHRKGLCNINDDLRKEKKTYVLNDISLEANSNYEKLIKEIYKYKTNKGGINEKQFSKLKKNPLS